MTLPDRATCRRIFDARDARYDGRIFVGVTTTGIFCRPICPVRAPKPEHCVYFGTAVAAQAAGFRPCLRCRPEIAPTLAAWNGTSTTVDRALALIAGGALDDRKVGDLALKLGIGERHLRRLFVEHLGTTPIAVVQVRRVLFAKTLITDTSLPMARIALASGFSSVRRFNEVMRRVYKRAPTELRRARALPSPTGTVTLELAYAGPYDWPSMTAWLGARAIAGVETVRPDGTYARSVAFGCGKVGTIEATPVPERSHVRLTVRFPTVAALLAITARVRRIFDLDADLIGIEDHLARDPRIRPLIVARPGLRVPGSWDGYELAVRAVLGQQISVAAASALAAKLVRRFGTPLPAEARVEGVEYSFPEPAILAEADIASLGMPAARADAVRNVARAAVSDPGLFAPAMELGESIERLCRIRGVGAWTAHYIAMRALREPDAFPDGDVGLMRALESETGVRPSPHDLATMAQAWRPWRAYAALHLWAADAERQRARPAAIA